MMGLRRPFAHGEKRDSERPSLPLPSLSEQRVGGGSGAPSAEVEAPGRGEEGPAAPNRDVVSRGLKNLEALLRALGFDGAFAERVSARLAEIDKEVRGLETEVARLEEEKRSLLKEREKILSVVRAFAGVE